MRRSLTSWVMVVGMLLMGSANAAGPTAFTIKADNEADITVKAYAARGNDLLLWLPPDTGFSNAENRIAAQLAQGGVEVWLADLLGARFLPALPSSFYQIPANDVVALYRAVAARTRKSVYIVTAGRGAIPALKGLSVLQHSPGPQPAIAGAILLYPDLYTGTPDPGKEAEFLPFARQIKLPMIVLQPELSPWHWRLDALKQNLEKGGSRVQIRSLPGVRDRFYYRDDVSPLERAEGKRLPRVLRESIAQLKRNAKR